MIEQATLLDEPEEPCEACGEKEAEHEVEPPRGLRAVSLCRSCAVNAAIRWLNQAEKGAS